ncbi:hypothetical protein ACOAKC_04935 [Hathewaya histolytica]|uniref:hypothetical protein n=1 Tax=Hathewaya histolytica TaxID=1498 RepID=UPI003B6778B0
MTTICLDESGDFENERYLRKFVGGIIYTGEDCTEEEKRVEEFLKQKCLENNLEYPKGIHSTEMKDKTVKYKIEKDLVRYIKENKKYHFICLLKGKQKRSNYKNLSNIVNDSNASNLYEHMVCNLIFNSVFYNRGFYDDEKINLQVATRSIPIDKSKKNEIKKYMELGYSYRVSDDNKKYIFYLTDIRTYKSAIGVKMMENKINKNIDFTMNVTSINYKKQDATTTSFLYVADFVCDIIKDYLDKDKNDFNIRNVSKEITNILGKDFLCWVYDDIDSVLNDLVKNINKKDLIACLNESYNLKESKSYFQDYYWNYWYKHFKEDIKDTFNVNRIDIYISEIKYMFSKEVHDYKRGLYIALELWSIFEKYHKSIQKESKKISEKYFYRLSDLILRGYNHIGDTENAEIYFKICDKYKETVNIEEYISTINRIVQIDVNEFKFNTAIERLEPSLLGLEVWKKTKKEVSELMGLNEQRTACLELRGKVLSSIGQFNAFKREKENAEEYFEKALGEFIHDEKNRTVTLSYYMHLAIDNNDFNLYKKYEQSYFGTDDINEQFKSITILSNKEKPDNFKLFVYIKALNVFYGKNLEDKLLDKIRSTDYIKLGFSVASNPWQLIYKHISLILYKKGKMNEGDTMIEKAVSSIKNSGITIDLINLCSKLQASKFNKDLNKQKKILKEFKMKISNNNYINNYFKECFSEEKDEEIVEKIINKFTYTYV